MELSPETGSADCKPNKGTSAGPEVEQVILEFHFEEDDGQTGFTKVVQIPSEVIQTTEVLQLGTNLIQVSTEENATATVPDSQMTEDVIDKVDVQITQHNRKKSGNGSDVDYKTTTTPKATPGTDIPVIHCYAPECENNSSTSGITMIPFPIIQMKRRKWATLLRLGKFAVIPSRARLCSWHFPEGVKKGPTRFQWNEAKSFALNFPTPAKRRRRGEPEPKPEPNVMELQVEEMESKRKPDPDPILAELQSEPSDPTPDPEEIESKSEPKVPRYRDEFRDFTRNDLVNKIRELIEQKKSLKVKLKAVENENDGFPSLHKKGKAPSSQQVTQMEVQQLQDRWAKEKKLILEANAALAFQVKKEQTARISLEEKIKCSGLQVSLKHNLRYENCVDSVTLKYFTGIPSKRDFEILFKFLEPKAKGMKHWDGKSWSGSGGQSLTNKKTNRIDNRNQLFLTLSRYKRGYATRDLGFLFGVDAIFISTIFITFSKLIESELERALIECHEIEIEREQRPEIARTLYPNLFAVLGSIDMQLDFRSVVYTQIPKKRKASPLYRLMYLCSTSGNVIHLSSVFPGKATDKEIASQSNILDMVPSGSELFAGQELGVAEECIAKGIQLRIFSIDPNHVLVENDAWETKLLTTCRMKIRKLIGLIKYFKIFGNDLHCTTSSNTPLIIRATLLLQNYIDTKCSSAELDVAST